MTPKANALVIGFGSAGARHARNLGALGCKTAVVSRRKIDFPSRYEELPYALEDHRPDYVVIANSTDEHLSTIEELAALGYSGTVLVEKPLFSRSVDFPANRFRNVFVGYNLRFHPVLRRLRSLLKDQTVISAQAYVGQYLPSWRPERDYRKSYSANRSGGGGVLRDLSHELDYLTWLLGGWTSVAAVGGHLSDLEIDSDDVFGLMLTTANCPVVLAQLNYLDRKSRRSLIVNTAGATIEADLVEGTITVDRETTSMSSDADEWQRSMHREILEGKAASACTLKEGLDVLCLIEAAEASAANHEWKRR